MPLPRSLKVLLIVLLSLDARGALALEIWPDTFHSSATDKLRTLALIVISCTFPTASAQAAFQGEECVTTDDCWDGRACLGGKCCDFSESDRNNSWNYYDQWSSWGRGNCTACGGKQAGDTMDPNMTWTPDGVCTACAQGTQLIEYGAGYMNGFYNQEGMCAPMCSSTQYLTNNRCVDKRSPGQYCDGWCTGDNCNEAKAFELTSCSSGLCGYQYCCDEQAVTDGCSGYCDSGTGACSTKVARGEECVTTDDCWDGRACLGGKCCDFSESDRNNSWNYYDQWSSWGRGNCTACGGKQAGDTMDPNMTWTPDGVCTACAQGTQLIEYGAGYMNGFYNQEGMCAPMCSSTQYLTNNRCVDKRSPGQYCDGWCTGDNCNEAKAFELTSCSSGLCGYQYCCDEQAVTDGCSGYCDSGTGACSTKVARGEECVTTDDCWDGRACLGGKCCDFSESDRNNSWNYYDQWSSWGRGNCTACGGKQAGDTMDPNMTWTPDGVCTACAQGTQLIEYGAGYMNGFYNQEGMCAPMCSSTQYLTNNRCVDKRSPGQYCDGWCTGDNCNEAKAFELTSCSSGLCGYQYCCDEAAVIPINGECCLLCASQTGGCISRGACPSPPPPPFTAVAEVEVSPPPQSTAVAQAEVSRDALLSAIGDTKTKAKAKLLADAAVAGVKVKKVAMTLVAESEDAACGQAFLKMKLDAGPGLVCDVATSNRRRRRLVAVTMYDVTVFVSPAAVDETTLGAALDSLAAEGVVSTTTQ